MNDMTDTNNTRALAALRELIDRVRKHALIPGAFISLALTRPELDTLIAALDMMERVRVAPVGYVTDVSGGRYFVDRDDPHAIYGKLDGRRVALLALPIDTTGAVNP